jgi:multidrug efflux system membrane fusion protein
VDPGTGNVTARGHSQPGHLLLPGMYLRAVLPLAGDDQAMLVPQQAVTRDAKGEPVVKLLGPGDTVVERRIHRRRGRSRLAGDRGSRPASACWW